MSAFLDSKVGRPATALKGFSRVHVRKGEIKMVTIPLRADDIKYWDVEKHAFVLEKGKLDIAVGASSADLPLSGEITIL